MPSFDNRLQNSFSTPVELGPFFSSPGSLAKEPSTAALPLVTGPLQADEEQKGNPRSQDQLSPVITRQLTPAITRQLMVSNDPNLTRVLTGTLFASPDSTTPRPTVLIKSEMKKIVPPPPVSQTVHKKRSMTVSLAGVIVLLLITIGTLLAASPMSREIGQHFNPLQLSNTMVANTNNNPSLIAQATATAVYYRQTDGYDPNAAGGGYNLGSGNGSLSWPLGQCTFWANTRYHALTGYWVAWSGNAAQWYYGAAAAGWHASTVPHIPSIAILMPGVQGASGYGHVAVVEGITGNVVHTSNMNWWANGGGWDRVSSVDFTVGPGVYFVWRS